MFANPPRACARRVIVVGVCVCVCGCGCGCGCARASAMFVNASHKAAVLVIRLTYTSTKTCIKMNGMTTVNTFIHYPSLSCARVMHFPSAFHF